MRSFCTSLDAMVTEGELLRSNLCLFEKKSMGDENNFWLLVRPRRLCFLDRRIWPSPLISSVHCLCRQRSQRDTHSLHLPESTLFTFPLPPRLGTEYSPCHIHFDRKFSSGSSHSLLNEFGADLVKDEDAPASRVEVCIGIGIMDTGICFPCGGLCFGVH